MAYRKIGKLINQYENLPRPQDDQILNVYNEGQMINVIAQKLRKQITDTSRFTNRSQLVSPNNEKE